MNRIPVFLIVLLLLTGLPKFAYVLDDMEFYSLYSTGADAGASASVYGTEDNSNPVVILEFSFTTGAWATVYRDFTSWDFFRGDQLRFKYKAGGSQNKLEVKLTDGDTETFWRVLNTTDMVFDDSWQTATVPLSEFTLFGAGRTDNTLDTDAITKIEFAVSRAAGGSGYFVIDNIELYQSQTFTDTTFDNFEDSNLVSNFGTNYFPASSASLWHAIWDTNPYAGAKSLKIHYNSVTGDTYVACGLNNANLFLATHLQFAIRSDSSGDKVKVELGGGGQNYKVTVTNIPTSWSLVTIPLESYRGGSSTIPDTAWFSMNGSFGLTFDYALTGRTYGTVYIDNIKFIQSPNGARTVNTFDDFEGPYLVAYSTGADAGSVITKSQTLGYSGYGLRLDYNLGSGNWAVVSRQVYADLNRGTGIRFKLKGGSASKDLEVKIKDSDNTIFYKKLTGKTANTAWQTISIPYTDMSLFSAGTNDNKELSLSATKRIEFAVSGSGAASGSITLDDLEVLDLGVPGKTVNKGIISAVLVENNPFSPNNDGVKDYVRFNYSLKEAASVKFEIVDQSGDRIIDLSPSGVQAAGSNAIIWNGSAASGTRVRNGLYFFHIDAKGTAGGSGKYTNIIAVIR